MKKIGLFRTLLLLLGILTLGQMLPAGRAWAEATPAWIQAGSGTVNLRQGPGAAFEKVGELMPGKALQVLGQEKDWYKVGLDQGGQAYVASWLVTAAPAPDSASATAAAGGQAGSDKVVKVVINGQPMIFDVDPVIDNGRTLVPMAAIFSAMGADITWNGDSKTVTAHKGDITVVLPIGSLTPSVNGKTWNLDAPARIVENRTLAPLAFVGQALGGMVAWDADNFKAQIFSPPQAGDKIVAVKVDGGSVNLRSGPSTSARVITTVSSGMQLGVNSEQNGWYQVHDLGQDGWVAGWVVTPVWSSDVDSSIMPSGPTTVLPTGSNTPIPAGPTTQSSGDLVVLNYSKGSGGIRLTMQSGTKSGVQVTESPGSIVYNFAGCYLQQSADVQEKIGADCLTITGTNQGQNVVVRVSLPAALAYRKSSENNEQTQVLFIPNCITSVNRQTFNTSGERIDITTLMPVTCTQQQSGNTMVVGLVGASQGIARSSYNYSSQSLESMTFAQQASGSNYTTKVNIETKEAAKFSVGQNDDGTEVHILFINQRDIPARNSLVVIDPGHGGKETGACGAYSQEKDINLNVALKVGAILQQKGIKVAYTRTDDTFVALENRAATANLMNAALFVSIHCNSWTDSNPHGTETFYYAPLSNPDLYLQKDERIKLDTAIQTRLISALGRTDRGGKEKNLSVLRNTDMPSALAELAFISNPEEEALLSQDSFRQKAAQAIADGIAACMPGSAVSNPTL